MSEMNPSRSPQTVTRLGSYRLIEPLGSGGMSSVFRAVHEHSGYEVAVKVLPRYLAKNPTLLQRFLREAQSAESLEHPNIVSIYDRGAESGRHYLVLEFVHGSDLHDRVRQRGPLEVSEAIRVIEQAAEGLKYASSKGVIHRDIKPANLLMDVDGTVKLIDLGLALQNEAEDERVTRDGTTVGTVDYMAPEQARDSRAVTMRSDMYSLGCTFYFLLTGFPPFPGGNIAEKLRRHALTPPPDVRQLRPDIPRSVAHLIQRMMAKRPEDRFDSYDELIEALTHVPIDEEDDAEEGSFEFALIADEDEEEADFSLGEGVGSSKVGSTLESPVMDAPPEEPETAHLGELRLAELAELLDDEDDEPPARSSTRPTPSPPAPSPRSVLPAEPFDPFSDLHEDDETAVAPMPIRGRRSYGQDASARAWAIGGALVGLIIALLGFALISLFRMDWSALTDSKTSRESSEEPGVLEYVEQGPYSWIEPTALSIVDTVDEQSRGDRQPNRI